MRTICFVNLKGGVAKTATTVNVAAILAKCHKKRVLIIDADSQCNSTDFYGGDSAPFNLADLLRYGPPADGDWGIQETEFPGVSILPGDESLMDLDLTKVETGSAQTQVLAELGQHMAQNDLADFILIDCPPAFNAASAAALLAADEVVIPIKLDAFSLRGMANLMRQISNMRKINPLLRLSGLLPTMWYRSDNITKAEQQLTASGLPVFRHIRRTDKVDDMTFAQQPLVLSSPKSAACVDYKRFVAELLRGGAGNGSV